MILENKSNIAERLRQWVSKYNDPRFWQLISKGADCIPDFVNSIKEIEDILKELQAC